MATELLTKQSLNYTHTWFLPQEHPAYFWWPLRLFAKWRLRSKVCSWDRGQLATSVNYYWPLRLFARSKLRSKFGTDEDDKFCYWHINCKFRFDCLTFHCRLVLWVVTFHRRKSRPVRPFRGWDFAAEDACGRRGPRIEVDPSAETKKKKTLGKSELL